MGANIHGKNTVVMWNAVNLSIYTESTDWNDSTDAEETTTYGPTRTRKSYDASLGDGKVTCAGTANDDAAGPEAILEPLKDAAAPVTFTYRPKGTGAGLPQKVVTVIITAFNVTAPVGGYRKWTCEMQMSGSINRTPQ
jgi:hypothetical protein